MSIITKNPKYSYCNQTMTFWNLHEYSVTSIMLVYLFLHPNCTRKTVQKFLYDQNKYSSYGEALWINLLAQELIDKQRSGRTFLYNINSNGKKFLEHIYGFNYTRKNLVKILFNFKLQKQQKDI